MMLSGIELMDTHLSLDAPVQTAFLVPRKVALGACPHSAADHVHIAPMLECQTSGEGIKINGIRSLGSYQIGTVDIWWRRASQTPQMLKQTQEPGVSR